MTLAEPDAARIRHHAPRVSLFGSLRIRVFRYLWLASMLSGVASFVQAVNAAWLMLELTGSPAWVGLATAAPWMPAFLLALPVGAVADAVNRYRMILFAYIMIAPVAVGTAVLHAQGALPPIMLVAMGLLLGAGVAVQGLAWQAIVPDLVPREQVAQAITLGAVSYNVARAAGPLVGGLVVAHHGAGVAFWVAAALFAAALAATLLCRARRPAPVRHREPIASAIAGGLRYARLTPPIPQLLAITGSVAFVIAAMQALLPTLVREALGGGAASYGTLLGVMGGGAVAGAFIRRQFVVRLRRLAMPVAVVAMGILLALLAASPHLLVTGAAMALIGILWIWIVVILNTTIQTLAPDWLRGRLTSLYYLAFLGCWTVGAISAGAVGNALPSTSILAALAIGAVLLGVTLLPLRLPDPATVRTPTGYQEHIPDGHPHAAEGTPVMVTTTWTIDDGHTTEFLNLMTEVRRIRLRTGAFRWHLYRHVTDSGRVVEIYWLRSWAQHLEEHHRIDARAMQILRQAWAFDRRGAPVTDHLAGVSLSHLINHRPSHDSARPSEPAGGT